MRSKLVAPCVDITTGQNPEGKSIRKLYKGKYPTNKGKSYINRRVTPQGSPGSRPSKYRARIIVNIMSYPLYVYHITMYDVLTFATLVGSFGAMSEAISAVSPVLIYPM